VIAKGSKSNIPPNTIQALNKSDGKITTYRKRRGSTKSRHCKIPLLNFRIRKTVGV
jgi:hypothetical protein